MEPNLQINIVINLTLCNDAKCMTFMTYANTYTYTYNKLVHRSAHLLSIFGSKPSVGATLWMVNASSSSLGRPGRCPAAVWIFGGPSLFVLRARGGVEVGRCCSTFHLWLVSPWV